MPPTPPSGAVVIGGYANALATIRALAHLRVPIDVVSTKPTDFAHHSRWVRETHSLSGFTHDPNTLLELLARNADLWKDRLLLPTNDHGLSVLAKNRDHIATSYRTGVPPWEVTRRLLEKNQMHRAAREVGIDIAQIYGGATPETADRADLRYPVLVKPNQSQALLDRHHVKVLVAHDRTELLDAIRKLRDLAIEGEVVDLIPGGDDLYHNQSVYIDRGGEPIADLPMRKLRKNPPFFGVCRVGATSQDHTLRERSIALLRHLGWRGMANLEYKLDPRDQRYRLLDVNGRPFLMQGLARKAGVNYPLLAWREAAGDTGLHASENGWRGVWIDLLHDAYFAVLHRHSEKLSFREFIAPYRRPKTFCVWSASDPLPFLALARQAGVTGTRFLLNKQARRTLRAKVQTPPTKTCRKVAQ
jgi:predicted ATP-grasp superfamily ATP-dependent carboligase